jgi:exodeoxyribonuclease VII small subunit
MTADKDKKITFEKALEKLEKIVSSMEDNQLSLDEMMKHFEEGKKLSDYCGKKLNEFEKKIEILVKENAKGGEWKNLEEDNSDSFELKS